jgi:hypothetical protein
MNVHVFMKLADIPEPRPILQVRVLMAVIPLAKTTVAMGIGIQVGWRRRAATHHGAVQHLEPRSVIHQPGIKFTQNFHQGGRRLLGGNWHEYLLFDMIKTCLL